MNIFPPVSSIPSEHRKSVLPTKGRLFYENLGYIYYAAKEYVAWSTGYCYDDGIDCKRKIYSDNNNIPADTRIFTFSYSSLYHLGEVFGDGDDLTAGMLFFSLYVMQELDYESC